MERIYKNASELVGRTPLLELTGIEQKLGLKTRILAKLELFNPAGSIKDRVALAMIEDAEKRGILNKNSVIIEPTSGNTGIGLSSIAASRGYKVVIVMPDSMSIERQKLMAAYGAEVVLSPGKEGMSGAIRIAKEIKEKTESAFIPGQFDNPANPKAHYSTTGPEILEDTSAKVDIFISGVGTGGTITGVGRYLKERIAGIQIVAVEPEDSPVLSEGRSGSHTIQGIGAGFVPDVLDLSIIDSIERVSGSDAFECARLVGRCEGILVGISSGAALSAAIRLSRIRENEGKTIVVIFPDTGDRYLSANLF